MRNPRSVIASLAFTLSFSLSSTAFAADIVEPPQSPQPPQAAQGYNWGGAYIGAGFGAGAIVHELDIFGLATFNGIGGEGMFG